MQIAAVYISAYMPHARTHCTLDLAISKNPMKMDFEDHKSQSRFRESIVSVGSSIEVVILTFRGSLGTRRTATMMSTAGPHKETSWPLSPLSTMSATSPHYRSPHPTSDAYGPPYDPHASHQALTNARGARPKETYSSPEYVYTNEVSTYRRPWWMLGFEKKMTPVLFSYAVQFLEGALKGATSICSLPCTCLVRLRHTQSSWGAWKLALRERPRLIEVTLGAWFYNGAFVTTRVTALISAHIITAINGYFSTREALIQAYPECGTPTALEKPKWTHVAVHASWNEGPLGRGSASRASFGMALWVAMFLHILGIELYVRVDGLDASNSLLTLLQLRYTQDESKKWREWSERRANGQDQTELPNRMPRYGDCLIDDTPLLKHSNSQ
ncbi:hypothetical protein AG1IA_06493 [Rhizoctonia solani AG-1 IA]|uniref:Uncharacterized protein n=1 Tax=Thanatephorus cucumeris (strain AG1-IA) TaxID=983506 RepID=L8WNC1_THACA|nr:hypothetical protein AG1IA_06493 [Rhizoctonia solani AG-1 IA]